MPKFVWEINLRGRWRPQLFHGELPREMTARENAHKYRIHELTAEQYEDATEYNCGKPLDWCASQFPPPPPYTGKEN